MGYFPMYTDIRDFKILMVGGGAIALRRLKTLQMFHEHITVISLSVCKGIEDLVLDGFVTWISRSYVPGDLKDFDMVLAATDNREVNHAVFSGSPEGENTRQYQRLQRRVQFLFSFCYKGRRYCHRGHIRRHRP